MNILIVGCGKVGATLAEQLNEEGNNITIVDTDGERVNTLAAQLDVMGVVGNGATHTVQAEAGIEAADLLIAVTGSDELNLLCCLIAKISTNCPTIARIKDPAYSSEANYLQNQVGLAMVINPEQAAAAEIARVLRFPSALKIDTFADGRVEIVKFRLPEGCRLAGMPVKDVVAKLGCDILVCTVEREDDAFIARGDFVFAERDVVSIIASPKNAAIFFKKIDYNMRSVKDVMVVGGGDIARYLTRDLCSSNVRVKIIEKEMRVCDALSVELPEAAIIHGDAADQAILLEEGVRGAGAFVALTGIDEENILLSLFAQSVDAGKVVTKINRIDYDDVIKRLNLDTTIYPKNITADIILRYVRALKNSMGSNMETLYNLIKGQVEAAEFSVRAGSPVLHTPLMKLHMKPEVLIAAIIRGGEVIIPRGSDAIAEGDRVVVVARAQTLSDIADVLA